VSKSAVYKISKTYNCTSHENDQKSVKKADTFWRPL